MKQLHFITGNWVGTSTTYQENGRAKSIPAFEKIQYKVDSNLITIDLHSASLQLHTVIRYDEIDSTYYYCPFYAKGAGKYKGKIENDAFVVYFNEKRRLFFKRLEDGRFTEYGEKLVDGKWTKNFEDLFSDTP